MIICVKSNLPFMADFDNNLPKFFSVINVFDHLEGSNNNEEKLEEDVEKWGLNA